MAERKYEAAARIERLLTEDNERILAIERTWAEFADYIGLGHIRDVIPADRREELERIGRSIKYREAVRGQDYAAVARLLGKGEPVESGSVHDALCDAWPREGH